MPVDEQCECCEWPRPLLPYTSRHGVRYCQDCYDAGCDLVECALWATPNPWKELKDRVLRVDEGPTAEEMAEVYRSFGVDPPAQSER